MPGDLVWDVVHWEYDLNGDLMPRVTPKDLNYPATNVVEKDVLYGIDFMYTGTLVVGSNPPPVPAMTVVDNHDGATALATITGSSVTAVNHVMTSVVSVAGTTWVDSGNRTGNGTVTLTLSPGRYWAQVKSVGPSGTSYGNVMFFTVSPFADEENTYDYRVKEVIIIPGDKVKTLRLEVINK